MHYDLRVDTLMPGAVDQYLELTRTRGLQIRGSNYGRLEGFWAVDVGPQHQAVQLWSHADYAARKDARTRMEKNPAWNEFLPAVQPLMQRSEIRFLSAIGELTKPPRSGGVYELRFTVTRPYMTGQYVERIKAMAALGEPRGQIVGMWQSIAGRIYEVCTLRWFAVDEDRRHDQVAQRSSPAAKAALAALHDTILDEDTRTLIAASFSPLP